MGKGISGDGGEFVECIWAVFEPWIYWDSSPVRDFCCIGSFLGALKISALWKWLVRRILGGAFGFRSLRAFTPPQGQR